MWPGCGCQLQDWWDRAVAMERRRLWHQLPAAGMQLLVLGGLQVQSRQGRCCGGGAAATGGGSSGGGAHRAGTGWGNRARKRAGDRDTTHERRVPRIPEEEN